MRKTLPITLFICLFTIQAYGQNWLKVDWGSSREEVHFSETGQLIQWNEKWTYYEESIDSQMYARKYRFVDDSLIAATKHLTFNRSQLGSGRLFDRIEQLQKMQSENIKEMGEPDFIDEDDELSVKHFAWNLDSTFAIAQVDKDDESGNIWYSLGELTGNERRKRFHNKKGALRAKFHELTGEYDYSFEGDTDLPPNLRDNPSLSVEDKLISRYDEMEDRRIYSDPSTGNNKADDELSLFLVEQEENLQLVLSKTYSANNWLFINSMIVLADGQRFTFENLYDQVARETTSIGIKETFQSSVDDELEEAIRAIANAKEAKIRLSGENSYRDIEITEREKRALRNVLAVYDKKNENE
ncbi:MAG: hypothetical protein WDZ80_04470 [Candidatus Paceibacterota bacterium]